LTAIGLIVSNPMRLEHTRAIPENSPHFVSKATVIFCPSHLTNQWADEIKRSVSPKLNVFKITTKSDHAKYSYKDFMNSADVIIVSYQFLTNKNYTSLGRVPIHIGDRRKIIFSFFCINL
jgi:SNF2 family DNA or RNA helicase